MTTVMAKPKPDKQAAVIPDGTYKAQLVDIKGFSNSFGERLGFVFEIVGGQQAGLQIMRSTSPVLSHKGLLAQIISGLLGRELTADEMSTGINLDQLVGTDCDILVLQAKGKAGLVYSNVERVFRTQ